MDPCSQAVLGASLSSSFAEKKNIKFASFFGAVGGLFPDSDIFIRSAVDPLLSVEYHRNFTHSLFFAPVGGLLVTIFLYFFFKEKISLSKIFIFSFLGVLTHGFLDSCTSYGTSLLWPFSDTRISWNIISIIDPIFTSVLIISIISALIYKSKYVARIGLFMAMLYLVFGVFQYKQVENFIFKIAEQRNHNVEKILLNPTIGNNILWRTLYKSNGKYYIGAVHMPAFSDSNFKNGEVIDVIDENTIFPELGIDSVQRIDIKRFSHFSQGFIYLHPKYNNVIADLRYGTLPYDSNSLWGIEIDLDNENNHVKFKNLRNFNDDHYDEFWSLLNGDFENM